MLAVLVTSCPAWAGDGYYTKVSEPSDPWLAIGVTVLSLLCIAAVAFKSPHRTHLD